MKYLERSQIYKGTNVMYDPEQMRAMSYWWWIFMRKFGEVVVFNEHRYSPTTSRHQYQVRELAADKIDVIVRTKHSLDRSDWHPDALKNARDDMKLTEKRLASSRIGEQTRAMLEAKRVQLQATLLFLSEYAKPKRLLRSLHGAEE